MPLPLSHPPYSQSKMTEIASIRTPTIHHAEQSHLASPSTTSRSPRASYHPRPAFAPTRLRRQLPAPLRPLSAVRCRLRRIARRISTAIRLRRMTRKKRQTRWAALFLVDLTTSGGNVAASLRLPRTISIILGRRTAPRRVQLFQGVAAKARKEALALYHSQHVRITPFLRLRGTRRTMGRRLRWGGSLSSSASVNPSGSLSSSRRMEEMCSENCGAARRHPT